MLASLADLSTTNITWLFRWETGTELNYQLPDKAAKDGALAILLFNRRSDNLGHRVQLLLDSQAIQEDNVDFSQVGSYDAIWGETPEDEHRVTRIRHCSGVEVEVPDYVTITDAFTLKFNINDYEARFAAPKCSPQRVCKLFEDCEEAAFLQHMIDNPKATVLLDIVKDLVKAEEETMQLRAGAKLGAGGDVLQSKRDEAKRSAATRARTVLAQKRVERNRMPERRLSVPSMKRTVAAFSPAPSPMKGTSPGKATPSKMKAAATPTRRGTPRSSGSKRGVREQVDSL